MLLENKTDIKMFLSPKTGYFKGVGKNKPSFVEPLAEGSS